MTASAISRFFCCRSRTFSSTVSRDQAIAKHMTRLSDTMATVDCLRLHRRIPPRVEKEDVFGRSQIQSQPAGLQTDQKDPATAVFLKSLDAALTVTSLSVQV